MNELATAATEFWNFLWPAAAHLAVTVAIVLFLAPQVVPLLISRLRKAPVRRIVRFLRSKTAETLGLPKLVPAAMVFLILLVLVIAADLADFVGKNLPPTLLWTSPYEYVALGKIGELEEIWRHLPSDARMADMTTLIKERWAEKGQMSGYAFWGRRQNLVIDFSDRMKFYCALAFVTAICGFRLRRNDRFLVLKRLATVVVLLIGLYTLSIAYAVHCHKGLVRGQLRLAAQWAAAEAASADHTEEQMISLREYLQAEKNSSPSWWRLGLPSWTW